VGEDDVAAVVSLLMLLLLDPAAVEKDALCKASLGAPLGAAACDRLSPVVLDSCCCCWPMLGGYGLGTEAAPGAAAPGAEASVVPRAWRAASKTWVCRRPRDHEIGAAELC
jgi:hypothetical protein